MPTGCQQEAGRWVASGLWSVSKCCVYFSEVLTLVKTVLNWLPTPLTAVMMAMAMPAAIRPYSMAVAPDSFLKNDKMRDFMAGSDLGFCFSEQGVPSVPSVKLRREI